MFNSVKKKADASLNAPYKRDEMDVFENAFISGAMSANPSKADYFKNYQYRNTELGQDVFINRENGDILRVGHITTKRLA